MINRKVSIIIPTRNRAEQLNTCLQSLTSQSIKPIEVLVIDNSSSDNTVGICQKYNKLLPLKYSNEQKIGISYARNRGMEQARGNIIAFTDDDCVADDKWIESIEQFFQSYPDSVGVVGKSTTLIENTYMRIEEAYTLRWLMQTIPNLSAICKIKSGSAIDTKNSAFKASFIKKFNFSSDTTFGNTHLEDTELGERMFLKDSNMHYNPEMSVSHQYSTSLLKFISKNFWKGYGIQKLLQQKRIHPTPSLKQDDKKLWLNEVTLRLRERNIWGKVGFLVLFVIYPIFYKAGRKYAVLN